MSLRKSPTLTPILIASNRLNAMKSTGPRTARGKARSRLNRLRNGGRSREYRNFLQALLDAPPCQVGWTAQTLLSSQRFQHPLFTEIAEICVQSEINICHNLRWEDANGK